MKVNYTNGTSENCFLTDALKMIFEKDVLTVEENGKIIWEEPTIVTRRTINEAGYLDALESQHAH